MSKKKKRPKRSERAKKRAKSGGPKRGTSGSKGPKSRRRSSEEGFRRSRTNKRGSGEVFRGKVQKNPRGFAFLIVNGLDEDVYVSAEEAIHLMQGDTVSFTLRRRGPRVSANIKRVLSRATKEIFGFLVDGEREILLQTEEGDLHRLKHRANRSQLGNWVVARIEKYPTKEHPGLVSVLENFGSELKPAHDIRIATSKFGLNTHFSEAVSAQALICRQHARRAMDQPKQRKDLRKLPFVTIDGADAKDFDDAVLVLKEHKGSPFVLFVSIADVAFFVRPGTALDEEAYQRSTSTYFPGTCIPMLPESLSNDLCSLRPREDKLAFTAELHFDKDGKRTGAKFYESIIRTAERLTYHQVQQVFDRDKTVEKDLAHVTGEIRNLRQLYRKMDELRKQRGVLDFDLPESSIDVNEEGVPVKCYKAERFEAHKVIEEFMIAANSAVAHALADNEVPALYRVHEPPDPEKLETINQLLRQLGITEAVTEVSPQAFNKVLQVTHHLKGAGTLHQSVLRLQKQAHYESDPKGHFGLALDDYTHFTSPIRRYPDIVVHRALRQLIGVELETDKKDEELPSLEAMGLHTSECERRSMEAERFVVRRKQCWYLKERLGEEMDGVVAGVVSKGLFVSLGETCIEGFVPVEDLGGDYRFDEARMVLTRRGGHSYGIGDSFRVRLDRVSIEDGEITLGMV